MHMRNLTARLAVAAVLVGGFAAALPAHADVARYQDLSGKLTITLAAPYGYVHTYDITVTNPCDGTGAFTGQSDAADLATVPGGETISGTLNDGNINFTALYKGTSYSYSGSGPLLPGSFTGTDGGLTFGLTAGVAPTSTYKNHGAYVSANPDKNDAAHSCIGMPINSNQ